MAYYGLKSAGVIGGTIIGTAVIYAVGALAMGYIFGYAFTHGSHAAGGIENQNCAQSQSVLY